MFGSVDGVVGVSRVRTGEKMMCQVCLAVKYPDIKPNKAGLRVRCTEIIAPSGARGYTRVGGVYYWTRLTQYEQYLKMETSNLFQVR